MTFTDPVRLMHSGTASAELLKIYARRTRPGIREGVAAWYHLRPRLDAGQSAGGASLTRRWRGARLLSGALAATLVLLVLTKTTPRGQRQDLAGEAARTSGGQGRNERERGSEGESGSGPGGATGAVHPAGMEGSSGASGIGETAAEGGVLVCPSHAG